jgi:hypothetical protein
MKSFRIDSEKGFACDDSTCPGVSWRTIVGIEQPGNIVRAERRVGQMMQAQADTVGLNNGSRLAGFSKPHQDERPTLAEAGIDKNQRASFGSYPPFTASYRPRRW